MFDGFYIAEQVINIHIDILRPEKMADIFENIFYEENLRIFVQVLLGSMTNGLISNNWAWVHCSNGDQVRRDIDMRLLKPGLLRNANVIIHVRYKRFSRPTSDWLAA